MVSDTLKPCPFCGARYGRLVQAFTRASDTFAYWSVECLDCGCEIADDEGQEQADAAWNRRALSAQPTVDREAIARLVYEAMQWAASNREASAPPSWVHNGNSFAQCEARAKADAILALLDPIKNMEGDGK